MDDNDESNSEDKDRLRLLQGVRGETQVIMFDPSMLEQASKLAKEEAPQLRIKPKNDNDNKTDASL